MVKIAVIGWYGTETIGDRAILAGLIRIFKYAFTDFEIKLGSLFITLTERTLLEDMNFYCRCCDNKKLNISIFNSLDKSELKKNIKESDLLIVGGGPLMDITVMYMLEYAFKIAKGANIHTALLGCGWGPLKNKEYIQSTLRLINFSDLTIFRDKVSLDSYRSYINLSKVEVTSLIDPACFAANYFRNTTSMKSEMEGIVVNLRDSTLDQYGGDVVSFENKFVNIVGTLAKNNDSQIFLVPMHTFVLGGDDRVILTQIARKVNLPNVHVVHNPLNLEDTMAKYFNASFCVGMRFHAVLLQTILNGNNFILDYTDPHKGKIIGLLKELRLVERYKERYVSLSSDFMFDYFENGSSRYHIESSLIEDYFKQYVSLIRKLC